MKPAIDAQVTTAAIDERPQPAPRGIRIVTGQLHRVRRGYGWAFREEPPLPPEPVRRPARVARILALAHRFQGELDRGEHHNRTELARQIGLTRARVTQILDLLLLAPDLQEQILFLEAVDGREPLSERALRRVLQADTWADQRALWQGVGGAGAAGGDSAR